MNKIKELEKKVERGIKWLDKVKPGWHKKINLEVLNLNNSSVCVCGQVFGDFWKSIYENEHASWRKGEAIKGDKAAMTLKQSISRGFYTKNDDYTLLTSIWFMKISKLKEK